MTLLIIPPVLLYIRQSFMAVASLSRVQIKEGCPVQNQQIEIRKRFKISSKLITKTPGRRW